jgi:RNA polymerase sigma factor (sigma-70 family)
MPDPYLTRVTLLENIKEADENAWNEFCTFYWDLITGWARQFGCSNALAKDVYQETIISLMRQLPNFDYDTGKGRLRSFIKTIVKRRVYDSFRRECKYVTVSGQDEDSNDNQNNTLSLLDKINNQQSKSEVTYEQDFIWLDSLLRKAIRYAAAKLDTKTYQSFKLYVLEELPVETVAKETGINRVGTVYQHKSRFLSALKKEFTDLLQEFNDNNELELDKISDRIFSESLAHVVSGRKDLKITIINDTIPETLSKKLEFIKEHFPANFNPDDKKSYFIIINGDSSSEYTLNDICTIGRNKDVDISLDDPDISSIHCTVKKENDQFVLKDNNSTNGTYVNDTKLNESYILRSGDIISIGSLESLIFLN